MKNWRIFWKNSVCSFTFFLFSFHVFLPLNIFLSVSPSCHAEFASSSQFLFLCSSQPFFYVLRLSTCFYSCVFQSNCDATYFSFTPNLLSCIHRLYPPPHFYLNPGFKYVFTNQFSGIVIIISSCFLLFQWQRTIRTSIQRFLIKMLWYNAVYLLEGKNTSYSQGCGNQKASLHSYD